MSDLPDLSVVISQLCLCNSSVYSTMYVSGKQRPGALRRVRITVLLVTVIGNTFLRCLLCSTWKIMIVLLPLTEYYIRSMALFPLLEIHSAICQHQLNTMSYFACVHFNKSVKLTFVYIYFILCVETDHACKCLQLKWSAYFKADTISLLSYFVCALLKISSGLEDNQT